MMGTIFGFSFVTILIIGLTLPKDFEHSRYCHYQQAPQTLWNLMSDIETNYLWRQPHLKKSERIAAKDGKPEIWKETYLGGDTLVWEIVESKEPTRLIKRVSEGPVSSEWLIEVSVVDDKSSRITITEKGKIDNPFGRFVARISFGTTYIDQYLMDVANAFKEKPKILTTEVKP